MRLLRWIDLCYLLFMGIFELIHGFEQDCPIDWSMYESVSKEKALIKCLLERYSNYTTVGRPVTNTSDLITVEFGLSLVQIMDVDEKNQVLETNVWYTYQWKDALLKWDPDKFDGLKKIMVPPDKVWIPDIVLYNFADSRLTEQRPALVNVFDDGTILWMPQAILRSTCAFNTTYFPFDETECHLKFGSWTHDGTKMDLQFFGKQEKFMVEDFIRGNEWELYGNHGRRDVEFYECCEGIPYLDLKFFIRLKRRTAFYSFILLLPCALLSCLTLTIFWVPPESPAKLQLGMNIFVAFFVLLLLLSESTPKAAESIPLIGAYFCLSMVMITMSTVLSTVIANMFFRGVRINRAPRWLRALMIDGIATVLCLRSQLLEPDYQTDMCNYKRSQYADAEARYAKVRLLDNGRQESRGVNTNYNEVEHNNVHNNQLGDLCLNTSFADDIRTIREILEQFKEKKAKAELKEKCLREWKVICCVTDRLFFISYLLVNIVGIVVIFFGQPDPS
ncbi:neuronal acetylcholine receptor subunit alpha-10-like isoform X3 [Ruditapes philippinarum]|uniref:neuronal acetylcholine receptor subunit alpha-10-like isoform X3 n=1 Tax=Ruditapes philippinarum TaxID=129788 RepID=UPI00295B1DA4|nr:neuronal acetylcholine receptor subunit alpha-10-like isoform X3 [Ruditapes philippinarum]